MADTSKIRVEVVTGTVKRGDRAGETFDTVLVTVPGNRAVIRVSSQAKLDALTACGFDANLAKRVAKALEACDKREGTAKAPRAVKGSF